MVFLHKLARYFFAELYKAAFDCFIKVNDDKGGLLHKSLHFRRGVRVVVGDPLIVKHSMSLRGGAEKRLFIFRQ